MKAKKLKIITSLLAAVITVSAIFSVNIITNAEVVKNEVTDNEIHNNSKYCIGSISKMFATVSVMILVDEGKIDLDAPLTNYIPEFEMADERYKQITPRMLLNHSSGLKGTHYNNTMLLGDNDDIAYSQLLNNLKSESLKSDPGEFSVYCNDGFTLAEILVERVSGMSFTDFIHKYITNPLKMNNTMTPRSETVSYNFSKIYSPANNMELPTENANIIGAGGIYSTAEDLCKFSKLFMNNSSNTIVSKKSIEAMENKNENKTMVNYDYDDSNFNYGLGWDSVDLYPFNQYGIKALSKGGTTTSCHSNLTVLPEENMSAAVISSGGEGFEDLVSQQILLAVLEEYGRIDKVKDEKSYESDVDNPDFKHTEIPKDILEYEGLYMGQEILKVEFKDKCSMFLSTLGREKKITQEYVYNEDGTFRSKNGQFISGSGNLTYGYGGVKGSTKLKFTTAENGEKYIVASSYESYPGLGQRAESAPIAEKVLSNNISPKVNSAWKDRNDKKYYVINEKYTSSTYIYKFKFKLEYDDECEGYYENTKIIDENTSKAFAKIPVMTGRDWQDYTFYEKNNAEYVEKGDNIYICEDGIKDMSSIKDKVKIGEDGYAKWYKVSNKLQGHEITVNKPKDGNFFVYDEDDRCVYSSVALNSGKEIILPKNGKIVFVGKADSEFKVKL